MATTQETTITNVLSHHLIALSNNDLDEIIKDYTEESKMLTPDGPLQGIAAIRAFFADLFVSVPTGCDFEMKQRTITGNVAYLVWRSDSAVAKIPHGTDTFLLEGDKIRLQTVAALIEKK